MVEKNLLPTDEVKAFVLQMKGLWNTVYVSKKKTHFPERALVYGDRRKKISVANISNKRSKNGIYTLSVL